MRRSEPRRAKRRPPDGEWGRTGAYLPFAASVCSVVYVAYGHQDKVLYVGVSSNLLGRLGQHSQYAPWFGKLERLAFWEFDDRADAERFEKAMIVELQPPYNTLGLGWRYPWADEPADPLDAPIRTTRRHLHALMIAAAAAGQYASPRQLTLPDELDAAFQRGRVS